MSQNCNICGAKVDFFDGGCVLQLAFYRRRSLKMSNISFCAKCYDVLLREKFKAFAEAALLHVSELEDGEENG